MDIERSKKGVLVTIGRNKKGEMSLVLDDIIQGDNSKQWERDCFYTMKDLERGQLDEMEFSEEMLSGLGTFVLARLNAFKKCDNN